MLFSHLDVIGRLQHHVRILFIAVAVLFKAQYTLPMFTFSWAVRTACEQGCNMGQYSEHWTPMMMGHGHWQCGMELKLFDIELCIHTL